MAEELRKLAHVEKIIDVRPISGADSIEVVSVLGWECVVAKKDNFKIGDLVVYVEIDSICPEKPEFEFLRDRKFRVKTIKLRKQISQGLVLPLGILYPITREITTLYKNDNWKEGTDVTETLGITHFDKESSLHKSTEYKPQNKFLKFILQYSLARKIILPFIRKPKGAWPGDWLAKTDELRIQNAPGLLRQHEDVPFFVTEKIDYQSVTFFLRKMKSGMFNKLVFGVCSRNQWIKTEDNSLYWEIARKYNIEKALRNHYKITGEELTLQGEQGNQSVQKNKYGIKEPAMWVFNIINNRTGKHFGLEEMLYFCEIHDLQFVPVLDKNFKLPETVNEMVEYSKGNSILNKNVKREGVVIRHIDHEGKKISFKAINPEFLLKYEKED
jgi:uncharacterized protein/RNA ligase-like protein